MKTLKQSAVEAEAEIQALKAAQAKITAIMAATTDGRWKGFKEALEERLESLKRLACHVPEMDPNKLFGLGKLQGGIHELEWVLGKPTAHQAELEALQAKIKWKQRRIEADKKTQLRPMEVAQ